MKRNSFVFYDSFYLGIKDLSDNDRLAVYDAVIKYAIEGQQNSLNSLQNSIFSLIKPQLDANNKKYKNGKLGKSFGKLGGEYGKLGGRPKTPQKPPTIPPKNPPNVNENVNENVNVERVKKDNPPSLEFANKYLTKWNEVFGTQYSATRQIVKPLTEWLKDHPIEKILEAIGNIKNDPYWKNENVEPIWLLRFKDPKGEPVDRIEKFYNTKPVVKWQTHL
jgi:hypothetical protein